MRRLSSCVALVFALLICAGCSSVVQSSKVDLTKKQGPIAINKAGYYFLPKVKVRIEGERKTLSPSKTKETQESTSKEKQTVTSEKAEDTKKTETDKKSETITTKTSSSVLTDSEKFACTLAIKETFTEPDPKFLFSLDHLRDYFADDKVAVTLTANGLLAKIDISAEDKTGEFVTKLAELAKESAKAFAAVSVQGEGEEGPPPFYFSLVVDPADDVEVARVEQQLHDLGCHIKVTSIRQNSGSSTQEKYLTPDPKLLEGSRNGIFFRPALPYTLTFLWEGTRGGYGFRKIENTLYLPNEAPVMLLDFERVAFGKYTHVVDFENGILKQMTFGVPSSALGFMTIPIEVAKTIANIPGEILQLKFNVISKEKDLLDKQAELINSQKKRLEAEEALRKYIEDLQKVKQDSNQGKQ